MTDPDTAALIRHLENGLDAIMWGEAFNKSDFQQTVLAAIDALEAPSQAPAPCPYCGDGKLTGLPNNACENCMNTGLADPPAPAPVGEDILIDVMSSLAAAISLLERSPKKAAPSDKMFDQMLDDYRASLERARAALREASHD